MLAKSWQGYLDLGGMKVLLCLLWISKNIHKGHTFIYVRMDTYTTYYAFFRHNQLWVHPAEMKKSKIDHAELVGLCLSKMKNKMHMSPWFNSARNRYTRSVRIK